MTASKIKTASGKSLGAAGAIAVLGLLAGCSKPTPTYDIAMCPEPIKVSDCAYESDKLACNVQNASAGTFTRNLYTWSYSETGLQLTNYPLWVTGMEPGQSKRIELMIAEARDTAKKVVICSMDPQNSMVSSRITALGKSR